jgi:hypothetical protein
MAPRIIREFIEGDAAGKPVSAVFLDTGPAMFAGESENDNVEMQGFATDCRVLTDIPGRPCTLVFWHPAKGATADNLTPRGGSSLLGAIDGNLTIWLDADSGVATLARSPWKWRGEHFDPLHFRLETVPLVLPSGKHSSIKVAMPTDDAPTPKASRRGQARDVALDALHEALSEFGEVLAGRGTSTVPPDVRIVRMHRWQDRWLLRSGNDYRDRESATAAFRGQRTRLAKAGAIRVSDPWVWPT